jgi:hypothetical protein
MNQRSNGYNPLRWKCDERGCFNELQRPKIEIFAQDLPGKIAFSDVDAVTEISGNFLFLEWKSAAMAIPTGQRIMWQRGTRTKALSVLCVAGSAKTMAVTHSARFFAGQFSTWREDDVDGLHQAIRKWAAWAQKNPRIA